MKHLLLFSAILLPAFSAVASANNKKKPARVAAGKLVYPVSGQQSNVGGYFGDYRNGGRSHKGIDIYAKKGTAVLAVCEGVITNTRTERLGGKTIRLRAATRGFTAYYAHLDKITVRAGERVQQGQAIGAIGNTGNAKHKAAHLHFGIIGRGRAVNPLPYVQYSKKIIKPVVATTKKVKALPLAVNENKRQPVLRSK